MRKILLVLAVAVLAAITSRLSFFTVEEGRSAIVVGWDGGAARVITSPGLHAKLPDPVQRVVFADMRGQLLFVTVPEPGPGVAYDALWRITDPEAWWKAFSGSPERTVREIADTVRKASAKEAPALSGPPLIRRGDFWLAQRVRQAAEAGLSGKGVGLEDLRVSEIHLSESDEKAALEATGRTRANELQDSGRMNRAGAEALLRSADEAAGDALKRAFSDASAAMAKADAEADAQYREIEAVTGTGGFASRVHDARAKSRRQGIPEPYGAAKGEQP